MTSLDQIMHQPLPLAPRVTDTPMARRMEQLAGQIRRPRAYIGQSAFLALALKRKLRIQLWQGEEKVDLVGVYAPWAQGFTTWPEPAIEAVICTYTRRGQCRHVSERTPLRKCNHYVAAARMEMNMPEHLLLSFSGSAVAAAGAASG